MTTTLIAIARKSSALRRACALLIFISGCSNLKTLDRREDTPPSTSLPLEKSSTESTESESSSPSAGASFQADRKAFADLRKEIPQDRQNINDEEALLSELFVGPNPKEERIREKFDRLIRKKREIHQREMQTRRQQFDKEQKAKREEFQKKQSIERAQFLKMKKTSEERRSYYADQEAERLEFNKRLKDDRDNFEDQIRSQGREFDSYAREKSADFNQRLRAFRESERLRTKELERKSN